MTRFQKIRRAFYRSVGAAIVVAPLLYLNPNVRDALAQAGFIIPNGAVQVGHLVTAGAPPVLTACGTGPAIVGTDFAGTITMGTGTPTGCVVTFAAAFVSAPNCVVNWQGTPLVAQNWTVTNTAITLVQTATSSNKVNYHCDAAPGG